MTNLTANQAEALHVLSQYEGRTVEVLTSGYTANVDQNFVRRAVGCFNSSALRGLEAKGYIKLDAFWKGARVTVLKGEDA